MVRDLHGLLQQLNGKGLLMDSLFFNEEIVNETLPLLGLILIFNSLGIIHFSFLEKYFQIYFLYLLS